MAKAKKTDPTQRKNARAYEKAVFRQEFAKKEAGATKYLADIKATLKNAGYNPDIVSLDREQWSGRATTPQIILSQRSPAAMAAAKEGFGQAPYAAKALKGGFNKATKMAALKYKLIGNTSTKGKSVNQKAK
jgi:hypothetical protein